MPAEEFKSIRRKILLALPAIAFAVALTQAQTGWQSPSGRDFPTVGGNLANQRYSSLKRITRNNIAKLGGAWSVHLEDGKFPGTMQATPVVVDGVMFISSGGGRISAIDAATGTLKWKHDTGLAGSYRGVAVAQGKVFSGAAGQQPDRARSEDRRGDLDDATCRSRARVRQRAGDVSRRPRVHGRRRRREGVRGQFGAYDAKTGKEVWKFWTVPGPGEVGHDTWEGESWKYGGAPVWTHPAIDPELGMVYMPTGNAGPDNDGTDARRRQPVHRVDRGARSEDGRLQVALPGSAPRHLGLR